MQKQAYHIRTMLRHEIDLAIDWAAAEGWNPGLCDAEPFYQADKNGFFVGTIDDTPVAMISATRYGKSFGFIGFYIVEPTYRNQGYGLCIWQKALAYLQGRTIGLDGVVAQQGNYQKSGFTLAYQNIRYAYKKTVATIPNEANHSNIVALSSIPFITISTYDAELFPDRRDSFLKHWLSMPNSNGVAFIDNDSLMGYGVVRQCRNGYKIGPLFADNAIVAEAIFQSLIKSLPLEISIYLDVPEVNAAALSLVQRYAMEKSFETARMYKGEIPNLPIDKVFGVTTFELG